MKETILSILKNNFKNVIIGIAVFLLFSIIYYSMADFIRGANDKPIAPVLDDSFYLNVKSDTGRLGCVFEQRRCYYKNLGLDKEGIISRCNELNYCDEQFKVKK